MKKRRLRKALRGGCGNCPPPAGDLVAHGYWFDAYCDRCHLIADIAIKALSKAINDPTGPYRKFH